MRKVKIASLVVLGVIVVLAITFVVFNLLKPKVAGIYIETIPLATVYIDGVEKGRTSFDRKNFKPGEVVIKLVPDSFDVPLAPYETKVNLVAGVQTVIRRDFGETDEESSGEIITFEKIDKNQVSLAAVSIPDSVELLIDGSERAFTPHRTTSLLPGIHTLTLRAEGYEEKGIEVRTHQGYKLTAVVKLAKAQVISENEEVTEEAEKKVEEEKPDEVKILSTPTGFLRVRSEPSILGQQVGTVEPEEIYELLETDEESGWYKIKFIEEGSGEEKEGWISDQYAEIVELILETPTITPKPTT